MATGVFRKRPPQQLFNLNRLPVALYPTAAPSGITGTVSATLGAVSLSAAGETVVSGSTSSTLGAVTLAAAGQTDIAGASSSTLGAVTLSASAAAAIDGALSSTLGAVAINADGSTAIEGLVAATLGAVGLSASGNVEGASILGQEVGMWHPSWDVLNQGSTTTVADLSGNGNDGTMVNGETSDWVADTTSGGTYAIKFDSAANERVQIAANDDVRITGDFSLSMWFRPDEKVENRIVISCGTDQDITEAENISWAFRMRNADGFNWQYLHEYNTGTNEQINWTSAWSTGTWYSIILVRDTTAKTVSLYQDGTLVSTQGYTNNPTGGTTGLMEIGGLSGQAAECLMRWDAVRVYNGILSAADITTLSNDRPAGRGGAVSTTLGAVTLSASGSVTTDTSSITKIVMQLSA